MLIKPSGDNSTTILGSKVTAGDLGEQDNAISMAGASPLLRYTFRSTWTGD